MEEGVDEGTLFTSCNICWQPLSTFYRASCNHVYCVECATTHFEKDPCCPICGLRLSQKHFRGPIDVGIATESVETAMMKRVFASNRLDEVVQQALLCLPALEDIVSLVTTQLYLEIQRGQLLRDKAERKLKKAKSDLKLTVQEARNKINVLTTQLNEAEAWKSKLNNELATAKLELHEVTRKNKGMEQILARLKNDGHQIPAALPSPASTPPHTHRNPHHYPPQPSPHQRLSSSSGGSGFPSSSKSTDTHPFPPPHPQQQYYRPSSTPAISPRLGPLPNTHNNTFYQPPPPPTPTRSALGMNMNVNMNMNRSSSSSSGLNRSYSPHQNRGSGGGVGGGGPFAHTHTHALSPSSSFGGGGGGGSVRGGSSGGGGFQGGLSNYRAPF